MSIGLLVSYLVSRFKNIMSPSEQIFRLAVEELGTDFTNDMVLSDDVSCAFAVTTLLNLQDKSVPIITGTYTLLDFLTTSPKFIEITEPQRGDLIISATGTAEHPEIIPNGHTGIMLNNFDIASNSSSDGLWKQNFTLATWIKRYEVKGGYPIRYFRKIA